jgi:tetratricopeptide (TPR) repeat protein
MSLQDTALEEEIRRLEDLRTRNPQGHTFARLADLYRKSGLPAKGLEIVVEGLAHHPHYLNAHLIHGRILLDLGRRSEAAGAFRRVLDIDDENLVALQALAALETGPDKAAGPMDVHVLPRASTVASADRDIPDSRSEPTNWLAQLEAEWRERRQPASRAEREEGLGVGSDPSPTDDEDDENVASDGAAGGEGAAGRTEAAEDALDRAEGDEGALDRAKPEAAQEVATTTLAELYLRQGLYEEAISVYEKLLARDPYSARLAASLDEARRLSREGPRRSTPAPRGSMPPAPEVPPPSRELPRPEAIPPPLQTDDPVRLTIREQLTAILAERAHPNTNLEPGALRRLRRWLEEAATAGDE